MSAGSFSRTPCLTRSGRRENFEAWRWLERALFGVLSGQESKTWMNLLTDSSCLRSFGDHFLCGLSSPAFLGRFFSMWVLRLALFSQIRKICLSLQNGKMSAFIVYNRIDQIAFVNLVDLS